MKAKIPPGAQRVLDLLALGHTLHSGHFGMWTIETIDSRCFDVNHNTAKCLVRRKLIRRIRDTTKWEAVK